MSPMRSRISCWPPTACHCPSRYAAVLPPLLRPSLLLHPCASPCFATIAPTSALTPTLTLVVIFVFVLILITVSPRQHSTSTAPPTRSSTTTIAGSSNSIELQLAIHCTYRGAAHKLLHQISTARRKVQVLT